MEMDLARTFVSFSATDITYYRTMMMWNAHEHIDFGFADFQLDEVNSENPSYMKSVCRDKIRQASTFVLLIGSDTYTKTGFVKDEVEVAIEKDCRLIGLNLNNSWYRDWLCPDFFADKGALFVPFSSRIVALSLKPWNRPARLPWLSDDWNFHPQVYRNLGYDLRGSIAVLPPPPNPFIGGKRPPRAK